MELQQLIGFLAVARTKSFSHAARQTRRTQPAISLQVKQLEEELGTRLFDRLSNEVALTEDGKALFELSAALVSEFQALKARFDERRGKADVPELIIATHASVMEQLLPKVGKAFQAQFPKTKLIVLRRTRQEIIESVRNGDATIGISSLTSVPRGINYDIFGRYRRVLLCPKDHPLAKKKRITLADIAGEPLIIPSHGSNTRAIVDKVFRAAGLAPKISMEITGREAGKKHVGIGFGVTILNEYYVEPADYRSTAIIDVTRFFGESHRGILTRKGKGLSRAAAAFVELIKEVSLASA